MKNSKNILLIFIILTAVSTVVAASLTVMTQSSIRSTFYTIALCMYAALALLAIFDIVNSRYFTSREKLLWSLVVLFGNILGVLVYILIGKKEIAKQ